MAAAALLAAVLGACEQQKAPPAPKVAAPVQKVAATPPEPTGPSFDCAKAATSLERLICSSPALARADREMAVVYQAQMDRMPVDQREALLDSQRSFLAFGRKICGKDTACLEWAYIQRTIDLKNSFDRPPAIITLTRYVASGPPENTMLQRTGRRLVLDQLAVPVTASDRLLNRRMAEWLAEANAGMPVGPLQRGELEQLVVEIFSITETKIVVSIDGPGTDRLIEWSPKLGRPLGPDDEPVSEAGPPPGSRPSSSS